MLGLFYHIMVYIMNQSNDVFFPYTTSIQIAGLHYCIKSQLDISWSEIEKQFILCPESTFPGSESELIVDTRIISVDTLPFPVLSTDHDKKDLKVWHDEKGEIRNYYASMYVDNPIYAQSRYIIKKEGYASLEIFYYKKSHLWGNPNLRIWNLLHLEAALLSIDAMVLHCSYMMYENQAILFSAPSGTGKTTQAKLWEQYYNSHIINGDKAVLMKKNNRWFVWGFPYHGSASECENKSYPLLAISVVRQSPNDYIVKERPGRTITDIYSEITVNSWKEQDINHALSLVSDICMNVPVVKQYCTMEKCAADTLHQFLFPSITDKKKL